MCDEATTSGSTGEGSCEDRALRSGHGCPGWKKAVTKRGLHDLVECVVKTHPGLDFLVQTKQFKSSDNSAMFAEEQAARQAAERARIDAVPGMIPANQVDMGDD